MKTVILEPDENPEVKYHSSISQHKNKLSVIQKNEFVPISYDSIDAITCDGIVSHREIVTDTADIGYSYAVCESTFVDNCYITHDDYGFKIKKLPEWFGSGAYNDFSDVLSFINTDDGSMGYTDITVARVGTKYALADKTLKADD